MKRIIYARFFKILISAVLAVCVGLGVKYAVDFLIEDESSHTWIGGVQQPVYDVLSAIYSESRQMSNQYAEENKSQWQITADNVAQAYSNTPQQSETNENRRAAFMKQQPIMINTMAIEHALGQYENDLNYYISFPSLGLKWTNQINDDKSIFYKTDEQYVHMRSYINGVALSSGLAHGGSENGLNGTGDYEIYVALNDEYINTYGYTEDDINIDIFYISMLLCIILVCAAFLIAGCGHRADSEEICLIGYDKVCAELNIGLMVLTCLALLLYGCLVGELAHIKLPAYMGVSWAAAALVLEFFILSLIRQLKAKCFINRSFLGRLFIKLRVRERLHDASRLMRKDKKGIIFVALLIVYTLFASINAVTAVIMLVIGALFILARVRDFAHIREGVESIRNGDVTFRIEGCKSQDYAEIAEGINDINRGMEIAVEKGIKAERMKAELITNVSHDLKTPLTSIINYTKLLEELPPEPAEARDYAKIISSKAQVLKNLTADLFEVSKAQSGNAEVNMEKIDVCLLIRQTMGELNKDIERSGLDFVVRADGEVFINADGRKMSRVFENLVNNILKYAMSGTRVFIEVKENDNKVTAEFKNISSYALDFDTEEITERFVRADKSRTEEGSGLGLAIAKSYTELCGGEFKIVTDGDLFKAVVTFCVL